MSKEEAFVVAFKSRGWWYRRRMMKNITNGLGLNMLEDVAKQAETLWRWTNYYSDKWIKS